MTKRNKNRKAKRRHASKLSGRISSDYRNPARPSLIRRFPVTLTLTEAKSSTSAVGYVNWGGALYSQPDYAELATEYAQARLVRVDLRYTPVPSLGSVTLGTVDGVIAHDPTSTVNTALNPLDYATLPKSHLWSSVTSATSSGWHSNSYKITNLGAVDTSQGDAIAPGTWVDSGSMSLMDGRTFFTCENASGAADPNFPHIMLRAIMVFWVEFRLEITRGNELVRSLEVPLQYGPVNEEKKSSLLASVREDSFAKPALSRSSSSSSRR